MNFKRDFLEASMALAPALSVPCEARLARGPAILSNPRNYRSASTNSQSSDPKAPNHQDGNPLPREGPGAVQLILLLHPSHTSLDSRPNGHELVRAQSRAILPSIRLCWPTVLGWSQPESPTRRAWFVSRARTIRAIPPSNRA